MNEVATAEKACAKCARMQPLDSFHVARSKPGGRETQCRECCRARRLAIPRERVLYYLKRRRESGKEERSSRKFHLKKTYGITLEQYDAMNASQGGLCAICCRPEGCRKGRLHVDHDHTTGRLRDLLCGKCNMMIGLAQESPVLLSEAISYLRRHHG